MIKILLVDDEILVRTNIKLMLCNYSDTLDICGEASNGREALPLLDSLQPNVILSDMIMPKMNGLALCEFVSKNYPGMTFIALSNYDDFDLVRGTLKNGGADYLLKHKLNRDTLYQLLSKFKPQNTSPAGITSFSENSINVLREKFVLDLYSNMFLSKENILYHLKVLNIPLDLTQVRPVILRIDNYHQVLETSEEKKKRIIEFSIINIGNEILRQYPSGIMTHLENEYYSILISFASLCSSLKRKETTDALIRQVSSNLKTYLNITTSYSIGKTCEDIRDLPGSYERARRNLTVTYYTGKDSILDETVDIFRNDSLESLDLELEKQLVSALAANDCSQMNRILDFTFEDIRKRQLSLKSAKMIFSDLISIITRVCKEKGIPLDRIFKTGLSPADLLSQSAAMEQVRQRFHDLFTELTDQLTLLSMGDSAYVQKAIAYINANYTRPITLQSAADEIGISHGYLSKIFKEETKQGFSDYLNSLRICIAAKLLDYGDTDLHKISVSCGFQDYAYFFRVFKKRMGMTPTEYRKENALH